MFFFLLAIALVWVDNIRPTKKPPQTSTPKSSVREDVKKYHLKSFVVIKIVDGDTVDIDIPDGKFDHTRIRLLGMDTPETKNPNTPEMYFGAEAADFITKIALKREVTVMIDSVANVRDKYGRLLAYLKLDDGTIINEELVRGGYAYADSRFAHSEFNKYIGLQNKAMKAKKGLWKEAKREDLPKWLQRKRPELLLPQSP